MRLIRLALPVLVCLAAAPAFAQELRATIGVPGHDDRVIVLSVDPAADRPSLDGCFTDHGGICTRTRSVVLRPAARDALRGLLRAIQSMPLCEPVGFAPGDPEFSLHIPGEARPRVGHLPRNPAEVAARTDEPCEAEHAIAAWLIRAFSR